MYKKNESLFYLGIIIILIIFINGCIFNSSNNNNRKISKGLSSGLYTYEVKIDIEGNGNYTLYLPIPILLDGTQFKAMENLSIIHGNGIINIIDTNKGKALEVNSNESITIKATTEGCIVVPLSMLSKVINETSGQKEYYWIYSNFKNNNITQMNLNIKSFSDNWAINEQGEKIRDTGYDHITINATLSSIGWQEFYGIHERLVVD